MVVGATAWLASTVGTRPPSHRLVFVQSHLTVPHGWSASAVTRMRATKFQEATDTMTVHGPHGLSLQITYTHGTPNLANYGWIPPGPPNSIISGESRLSRWSSPYRLMTWTSSATEQGYLAGTIVTRDGTYDWTTSIFSRAHYPTLYQTILRWAAAAQYPAIITPTEAVHAMMTASKNFIPARVIAWRGSSGTFLTAGIPATGEAPWYLFTTANRGTSWRLTYVSSGAPSHHRNGFPNTSPSDVLTAMAWTGPHTLWIAQTINCMSGPEVSGGTVTLTTSTNGGQSWHLVANRIHESNDYCPTMLRLSVTSRAKQPTVRLIERNATGTHVRYSWFPKQWRF